MLGYLGGGKKKSKKREEAVGALRGGKEEIVAEGVIRCSTQVLKGHPLLYTCCVWVRTESYIILCGDSK